MRIGLVVDHPRRDLQGNVFVARELARRGAEAMLLPLYRQGVEFPLLDLDAVVLNHARLENLPFIHAYSRAGVAVFVLDTEGGVRADEGLNSPAYVAGHAEEHGTLAHLTGYLFWGERMREGFLTASSLPAEKMEVTGCPRYDVCHPRYRHSLVLPRRDYVLVNTNFPTIHPRFQRRQEDEHRTLKAAGFAEEAVTSLETALAYAFTHLTEAVKELAAANPGRTFLLRPHPFEIPELYRKMFAKHPNVVVDPEGSIFAVVHNASCVLHVNCSTAVEATLLDTLPISVEFANHPFWQRLTPLPSRVSHGVKSVSELQHVLDHLDEATAAHHFAGNYARWIQPWFHLNDGRAAERVAEAILKRLPSAPRKRRIQLGLSMMAGRANPTLSQITQGVASNILGPATVARIRERQLPSRIGKRFGVGDVETALAGGSAPDEPPTLAVEQARHPITRRPMDSIRVRAR